MELISWPMVAALRLQIRFTRGTASRANQATTLYGQPASHLYIGITATNFWINTPINTSFLQDSEVVWHGEEAGQAGALDSISKGKPGKALWLKLADPTEAEGEHLSVYEGVLAG